jgi:hypothetical protein
MGLPFGKDEPWLKTGIGSKVLGGWLVNPVITALSGVPFTVTAGGNLNANGATQTADLVGPFHVTHGRPPRTGVTCALGDPTCSYFAASSFAAPLITSAANAHFGNTNRNQFRGPGYFNMNLSIVREFELRSGSGCWYVATPSVSPIRRTSRIPLCPVRQAPQLQARLGEAHSCVTPARITTSGSLPAVRNPADFSARTRGIVQSGSPHPLSSRM